MKPARFYPFRTARDVALLLLLFGALALAGAVLWAGRLLNRSKSYDHNRID